MSHRLPSLITDTFLGDTSMPSSPPLRRSVNHYEMPDYSSQTQQEIDNRSIFANSQMNLSRNNDNTAYDGDGRRSQGGSHRKNPRNMCRASLAGRRSYRRRVTSSMCRKKRAAVCRSMKNCKYITKGRRYCRKDTNKRRVKTRGVKTCRVKTCGVKTRRKK